MQFVQYYNGTADSRGLSGAKRQDTVRMDSDSRTLLCRPHAVVGHPDGTPSGEAYSGMASGGNESVARCATTATAEAYKAVAPPRICVCLGLKLPLFSA